LLGSQINGCDCNGRKRRPQGTGHTSLSLFLFVSSLSLSVYLSLSLWHCLAIMQRVLIMTTAGKQRQQQQKATSNETSECNPAVLQLTSLQFALLLPVVVSSV